jgi:hypothetical protein
MKNKEEKVKMRILITSLILALFIVGTIGIVSAQTEQQRIEDFVQKELSENPNAPTLKIEEATLWERIKNLFSVTKFTIVGQDRKCSVNPDHISWVNKRGDSYSISGGICTIIDNPPFGVNQSLFNVYTHSAISDTWVKRYELIGDDTMEILFCDAYRCKYEIYCCPHPECTSNSQCEIWEAPGSTCETKEEVDPWMPLKQITAYSFEYGGYSTLEDVLSYNYCVPGCIGAPIECWQIYNNVCQKATYACNYETYPNCPVTWPYTSESQCKAAIVTPECTTGEKECAGTILTECVGGSWVEKGRVNGECGYSTGCRIEEEACIPIIAECCDSLKCAFNDKWDLRCVPRVPVGTMDLDSDGDGYTDALEISKGTDPNDPDSFPTVPFIVENTTLEYTATQISLTKDDLKEATSSTILQATCSVDSNCRPYIDEYGSTNYTVKCVATDLYKQRIEEAAKVVCKEETQLFNFKFLAGTSAAVCAGSIAIAIFTGGAATPVAATICGTAIVGAVAVGTGQIALEAACEMRELKSAEGLCIATSKDKTPFTDFLKSLAFFDITGDEVTDGAIIGVGALLLFIIIFSRLAGVYGTIKYAI